MRIALEVSADYLQDMRAKGEVVGIETRGVSDHGFIDSIYFRDPNGYVIELAAKLPLRDAAFDSDAAHSILSDWQTRKQKLR